MGENRWRGYETWPVPGAREERWYLQAAGASRAGRPPAATPDDVRLRPRGPCPHHRRGHPPGPHPPPRRPGPATQRVAPRRSRLHQRRPATGLHRARRGPRDALRRLLRPRHGLRRPARGRPSRRAGHRRRRRHHPGQRPGELPGTRRHQGPVRLPPSSPGRPTSTASTSGRPGITFLAGHRIRVEVTSSCFPRWERNPNTGEDAARATRTEVARQTDLPRPRAPQPR